MSAAIAVLPNIATLASASNPRRIVPITILLLQLEITPHGNVLSEGE